MERILIRPFITQHLAASDLKMADSYGFVITAEFPYMNSNMKEERLCLEVSFNEILVKSQVISTM